MSQMFRLKRWSTYVLVADASTENTLGYFCPPKAGEVYQTSYEPDAIINLDEFPEYADIEFFWIYPLEVGPNWEQLGFTVEEALDWKYNGRFTPELAQTWRAAGFDCETAQKWRSAHQAITPEVARNLIDSGLLPDGLSNWVRMHIPISDIPAWIKADVDAREANNWHAQALTAMQARQWKLAGVSPRDAGGWNRVNLSPEKSKPWIENGFKPDSADYWQTTLGIDNPVEAKRWLESGLDSDQISEWLQFGYTAQSMQKKMEQGWMRPPESGL